MASASFDARRIALRFDRPRDVSPLVERHDRDSFASRADFIVSFSDRRDNCSGYLDARRRGASCHPLPSGFPRHVARRGDLDTEHPGERYEIPDIVGHDSIRPAISEPPPGPFRHRRPATLARISGQDMSTGSQSAARALHDGGDIVEAVPGLPNLRPHAPEKPPRIRQEQSRGCHNIVTCLAST